VRSVGEVARLGGGDVRFSDAEPVSFGRGRVADVDWLFEGGELFPAGEDIVAVEGLLRWESVS